MNHETYFSTQQPAPEEKTRISSSDEDAGGPSGPQVPAEKGTQESLGLITEKFPRSLRLRRRWEFQRVYRSGVRIGGRHIVLFALESEAGKTRLGITASKKTGNAVRRARARRRIREIFRRQRHDIKARDWDLVVNVRWTAAEAPWTELLSDFSRCLKRLESRKGSR